MLSQPPKYPNAFSAAEIIATNEDLLAEILTRVPVRPLLRFKCVCKLWRSLISTTQFSHSHTLHHPASFSGIFVRTTPGLADPHFQFVPFLCNENPSGSPFDSLNFVHDPAGIKILQSCNGLLLCSSLRKIYKNRNFYVYNPSTNQFSVVTPSAAANAKSTPILGLTLAFDPSKSPYYKIVCVRSSAVSVLHDQIEIYSSETRSWRSSGSPFIPPFDMVFDDGVFWNGSVHWLRSMGLLSLYFDVEREVFGKMPCLPATEGGWSSPKFRYFRESGGHLHVIEIHGQCPSQFKVLELKKDYSEWFVKYKVDLQALVDQYPEMNLNYFDHFGSLSYAFVVLFLARDDDGKNKDEASLLLHIPGKVISYNLKVGTFKKLCDLAPHGTEYRVSPQFGLFDAYQYIETLASV